MCAAGAAGLSVRPACRWHRLMVGFLGRGPRAFSNLARVGPDRLGYSEMWLQARVSESVRKFPDQPPA